MGLVEDVAGDVPQALPAEYQRLADIVRRLLLPLEMADKQALLESADPAERLALLAPLLPQHPD